MLNKHQSSRILTLSPLTVALGAFATSTLVASAAFACGGFFCNNEPIDQTGEEILFAVMDDGTMEAHVRVEYEGPSDQFAWIVPTPSLPEVGLSTERVFDLMDIYFGARFQVDWEYIGDCWDYDYGGQDTSTTADASAGSDTDSDTGNGVNVVLQDEVGPYDYAVLQATDTTELFEWLNANGYLIPDNVAPFVDPYVVMGNDVHFVAFRLTKTADAGDIQPIVLRYAGDEPMVPIQLTAVATAPDLGVTVNVLGYDRAVPDNYLHVHINEARIDWLNSGWNYDELVTEAMNEAGGQGFTTEYAGPSDPMMGSMYYEGQYETAYMADITSRAEFMVALQNEGFTGDRQLLAMLQQYMPVPEALLEQGTTARDYYNCVECYGEDEPFDAAGFAAALQERIVEPLVHAQDLFDDLPYLSRLYTTLSAEEMTLDPSFTFNADMDEVENVRRATAVVDCTDGGDQYSNPVAITLADGRSWVVSPDDRNSGPMFIDSPAAERYEETASVGAPQLVVDNAALIDSLVSANPVDPVDPGPNFPTPTPIDPSDRNRSGCSVASSATPASFPALLGLALVALRRRRR